MKTLNEFINETLLKSYNAKELASKIKKLVNIHNVNYISNKDIVQFTFELDANDYNALIDNEKFYQVLNLYNYYVRLIKDYDNTIQITLEPYKSTDITDKVYDDFGGILYHCTSSSSIDKILKTGLKPSWKRQDNITKDGSLYKYRDGRIFFVCGYDNNEIRHNLRGIMHTKMLLDHTKESDYAFLKIDINKYHNKIKFHLDSSGVGYKIFCEEPIPGYCCEEINLDDLKK